MVALTIVTPPFDLGAHLRIVWPSATVALMDHLCFSPLSRLYSF